MLSGFRGGNCNKEIGKSGNEWEMGRSCKDSDDYNWKGVERDEDHSWEDVIFLQLLFILLIRCRSSKFCESSQYYSFVTRLVEFYDWNLVEFV